MKYPVFDRNDKGCPEQILSGEIGFTISFGFFVLGLSLVLRLQSGLDIAMDFRENLRMPGQQSVESLELIAMSDYNVR